MIELEEGHRVRLQSHRDEKREQKDNRIEWARDHQ